MDRLTASATATDAGADTGARAVNPWLRRDAAPWPARWLALAVALLVTGPALGPGFVLLRDMVFVPRQDLDLDALGLGGALPRAVPVDAVMALLTTVVPGELVQKIVLVGLVFAAVLGAARLVPTGADGRRGLAAAAAGLTYGWSPYLAERLLLGHWTHLLAYAALPWIARAALRVRDGVPRALPVLVLTAVPAALSPSGALLAAGVVVAVLGRRSGPALGGLFALSLPWLAAGLLHPAGGGSDPAGVAAFAARGESWGGSVLAVLGTGGIWNADAVPASRGSLAAPALTLLLVGVAAVGWRRVVPRGPGPGLLVLGVLGLLLGCAGALPVLADLLALVVRDVPGAGLLRDGQKWVAWWALPLAVGAGLGSRRLAALAAGRTGRLGAAAVAGLVLLLPVLTVPDLAWGVGGRLQPVAYPDDWARVRAVLGDDARPGDVLVLPASAYRAFGWNDGRTLYDPAARWVPRPTVTDDTLVVGDVVVAGEDRRARRVLAAVDDPAELARLGVGWVLVEHDTPGPEVPAAVAALPLVVDGPSLALHRVPGASDGPDPAPVRVTVVLLAHALAAGVVVGSALWITVRASTVRLRCRRPGKRVKE